MPIDARDGRTKLDLESAMRELLRERPLEQIRVRELTERCNIRRQTFYYHFTDVYDLFSWSMKREQEQLCRRQEECLTWQQVFQDIFHCLQEDRPYYQTVLRLHGREGLWGLLREPMEKLRKSLSAYYQRRYPEIWETEAAKNYGENIVLLQIVLEAWVNNEEEIDPEVFVKKVEAIERNASAEFLLQGLLQNLTK